jgi:hypothetical protein
MTITIVNAAWVSFPRFAWQRIVDGRIFPLVISPARSDQPISDEEWTQWISENRDALRRLIGLHGAVLFRGFQDVLCDARAFNDAVESMGFEALPYVGAIAALRLSVRWRSTPYERVQGRSYEQRIAAI